MVLKQYSWKHPYSGDYITRREMHDDYFMIMIPEFIENKIEGKWELKGIDTWIKKQAKWWHLSSKTVRYECI